MAKVTAVIDIGSNSVRMAVYKRTSRYGFYLLKEAKSRVRISENAWKNGGVLQEKAMFRAEKAIAGFLQIAKSFGATKVLSVATSAVRDAPNRSEFVARIKEKTGLKIRVISGTEEAELGGKAAATLLPKTSAIAVDIGGGSTEVVLIENGKVVDMLSFNLGTVRLKELFFDEKSTIKDAMRFINQTLASLPDHFKSTQIIGVGGTLRALASVLMRKEKYPLDILHAYRFSFESNKEFLSSIKRADQGELRKLGFKSERLDVAREGLLIFSKIAKKIGAKDAIISGVGVREGLFLKQLFKEAPSGFSPSISSILDRFEISRAYSATLVESALKLFDELSALHGLGNDLRRMLYFVAKLSSIGNYIDPFNRYSHASYIVLNGLSYGFEHEERVFIATLIEALQKKPVSEYTPPSRYKMFLPSVFTMRWLLFILHIATASTASRDNKKPQFTLTDHKLEIVLDKSSYLSIEATSKIRPLFDLEIELKS